MDDRRFRTERLDEVPVTAGSFRVAAFSFFGNFSVEGNRVAMH